MSPVVSAPLEHLDGITLDELVAEAELLRRVDRKYILPAADASCALTRLDPRTRVLEFGDDRHSTYATMYFDTPDLLSYRLAAHGRRRRFKLRSRHYVDTGAAFLELKTRGGRGVTVKERIEQPALAAETLTDEGREYAAAGVGSLGLGPGEEIADALQPTLETRYRRTTLLLPGGARATVDTGLEWRDQAGSSIANPGIVVIETKSASQPSDLDRALWRAGIRPASISKFGTGLAALHPELPHNKWNRVLRRFFPQHSPAAAATRPRRSS